MATIYYPAILERGAEGFGVWFPDLPGCTSAGTTIAGAARSAEKALEGHLLVSAEHGDDIPAPSRINEIEREADIDEVALLLVRASIPDATFGSTSH